MSALAKALCAAPYLDGARCAGRWDIWDETECPETIEYAINQCGTCPALAPCTRWFDGVSKSRRPPGITAGRLNRPQRKADGDAA